MFNMVHHEEMQPSKCHKRLCQWVKNGKNFSEWSVWLALDTYHILAQEFGWEHFRQLIIKYYDKDMACPHDDCGKLDLWARNYSQLVNVNLVPFFEWFKWPLSQETKNTCSQLPNSHKYPMLMKQYE